MSFPADLGSELAGLNVLESVNVSASSTVPVLSRIFCEPHFHRMAGEFCPTLRQTD